MHETVYHIEARTLASFLIFLPISRFLIARMIDQVIHQTSAMPRPVRVLAHMLAADSILSPYIAPRIHTTYDLLREKYMDAIKLSRYV